MKTGKKGWMPGALLLLIMVFSICMPTLAASDDNSLSALNIYNGTLSEEFQYNIWQYNVTVDPGTTELLLDPTPSDENATVSSITGTVLEDGEATVNITVTSESGIEFTYVLYVTEAEAAEETEAVATEAETEPVTEVQTEAPETELEMESETEAAANLLQTQIENLRSDSDLLMKILYGLIALCVVLLFFIINLVLKNHDLKDDLKDAKDQLEYQTNEFARKERMMATDTYYAPTQQGQPVAENAGQSYAAASAQQNSSGVEETFGTRASSGGYQGMQPEDVPPNRPITAEPEPTPEPTTAQPEPAPSPVQPDTAQTGAASEKADVDITMVEL